MSREKKKELSLEEAQSLIESMWGYRRILDGLDFLKDDDRFEEVIQAIVVCFYTEDLETHTDAASALRRMPRKVLDQVYQSTKSEKLSKYLEEERTPQIKLSDITLKEPKRGGNKFLFLVKGKKARDPSGFCEYVIKDNNLEITEFWPYGQGLPPVSTRQGKIPGYGLGALIVLWEYLIRSHSSIKIFSVSATRQEFATLLRKFGVDNGRLEITGEEITAHCRKLRKEIFNES